MDVDNALRATLFDPSVPDWAFLTIEETCKAFGVEAKTLQDWKREQDFPEPTRYPGVSGYPLSVLRAFLKDREKSAAAGYRSKRSQSATEGKKEGKITRRLKIACAAGGF